MTTSTMTTSFEDLEKAIIRDRLIGLNIHYREATGTWNVWTRKRGSDGWSISGQHDTLEQAVASVCGPEAADDDDWEDLI